MKKVIYSFIYAIALLFIPIHVFAAEDISVNKTTITIEQGKSATFNMTATNVAVHVKYSLSDSSIISVADVPDWIDSEPGKSVSKVIKVNALKAGTSTITFNTTVATYDEVEYPKTLQVVVKVVPPKSSNANLSNIKIDGKELSGFKADTISYTLKNTDASSIKIDVTTADSKAKVSGVGTKNLSYGANTFNIVVTAENGSKKTYTIKVTKNDYRSSDNLLSSLTVNVGTINFNSGTTSYTINVGNDVNEIKIDAKAKHAKASVSGAGTVKLKDGKNEIKVVVTAENGSKKTYTINVIRKGKDDTTGNLSSNNNLKLLVVEGYEINFDANKGMYYLDVSKDVEKLVVEAISADSKANISINNPTLKAGENTIRIDVTAENGDIKTYKIIVNKEAESETSGHNCIFKVLTIVELVVIILLAGVMLWLNVLSKKDKKSKKKIKK